jgi:hypothetical protein
MRESYYIISSCTWSSGNCFGGILLYAGHFILPFYPYLYTTHNVKREFALGGTQGVPLDQVRLILYCGVISFIFIILLYHIQVFSLYLLYYCIIIIITIITITIIGNNIIIII